MATGSESTTSSGIAIRGWSEFSALGGGSFILTVCAAAFVYQTIPWLRFPADLLTWSEPGFVGSIMKLSQGVPIYGPPEDNNSVIYTPGAPLLTYAVMTLTGQPITVPTLRFVQVGFVALAVLAALASTWQLKRLVAAHLPRFGVGWLFFTTLVLVLAATSPRVNRLVLTLHADGLALLVSTMTWMALLWYVQRPTTARLVVLACFPALGFLAKQFLMAWLPVTVVVLACLPYTTFRQRATTVIVYGAIAGGLLMAVLTACTAIWGDHFRFWAIDIMGGSRRTITLAGEFNIALFRSIDHVISAWWELAVGAVGGCWLLWRLGDRRLVALMVGWVTLVGFEALTSGSGFRVLYHFGPAVLIGATFVPIALQAWTTSWRLPQEQMAQEQTTQERPARQTSIATALLQPAAFALIVLSFAVALQVVPTRDPSHPRWFPGRQPDAVLAQVTRIEQEVAGHDPAEVLVDHGNWVYLPSGHIALDRPEALGDQPPGGRYENFEPLLERIRTRHYRKIIVRRLREDTFMYDWWRWEQPSGVRQALFDHYHEIATVPAADGLPGMYDGAVSILIPNGDR